MAQYTEMGKKEKTTITILKLPQRSPLVGRGARLQQSLDFVVTGGLITKKVATGVDVVH